MLHWRSRLAAPQRMQRREPLATIHAMLCPYTTSCIERWPGARCITQAFFHRHRNRINGERTFKSTNLLSK